jgi:hypothetical protein
VFIALSKAHAGTGLSAKAACDACIAAAGAGKGGGKPDAANASIPGDQTTLATVLAAGKTYFDGKV